MSSGRDYLLTRFKSGSLPNEDDFKVLIRSMLHMEDEGFSKDRDHGLKITSAPQRDALVTFYRRKAPGMPLWSMRHDESGQLLKLHGYSDRADDHSKGNSNSNGDTSKAGTSKGDPQPLAALLTLDRSGRIGVGLDEPRHRLQVEGFVASSGRTGTFPVPDDELKPNGTWIELVKDLQGCVAFEVMACAGNDDDTVPRMAVLHAHAVNAGNPRFGGPLGWLDDKMDGWLDRNFNRKKRIRYDESRLGERCDRLELAWRPGINPKGEATYGLAIRSRCNYGSKGWLKVNVTQLWPVPQLAGNGA